MGPVLPLHSLPPVVEGPLRLLRTRKPTIATSVAVFRDVVGIEKATKRQKVKMTHNHEATISMQPS